MTNILNADLLEATRLTSAGRLTEATAMLQRMFGGGQAPPRGLGSPASVPPVARRAPPTLEGVAEPAGAGQAETQAEPATRTGSATRTGPAAAFGGGTAGLPFGLAAGTRPAMPEALRGLLQHVGHGGLQMPRGGPGALSPVAPVPDGAQFLAGSFSNEAGSRPYKLYVPSSHNSDRPAPLIVMLHGCTQSPDDFAAGTRMNEAAEDHGCLVVYPGQTASANLQKCWNWFSEGDQRRDRGEPSLIAGLTRQVMRDHAVDPRRVYVAGLSAGGAAAAIMGDAYPDLYAAIGVHSGLACGAARDMQSAFAAMQGGRTAGSAAPARSGQRRIVPAIVFHGDQDRTVNPRNGDAVVTQTAQAAALLKEVERGRSSGGQTYDRTLSTDEAGETVIEQWVVHGGGHAWFGGSAAGSYTDPRGPDATREMLRFFLEHPHPTPGG